MTDFRLGLTGEFQIKGGGEKKMKNKLYSKKMIFKINHTFMQYKKL
jgi:hypothetical protein